MFTRKCPICSGAHYVKACEHVDTLEWDLAIKNATVDEARELLCKASRGKLLRAHIVLRAGRPCNPRYVSIDDQKAYFEKYRLKPPDVWEVVWPRYLSRSGVNKAHLIRLIEQKKRYIYVIEVVLLIASMSRQKRRLNFAAIMILSFFDTSLIVHKDLMHFALNIHGVEENYNLARLA
jgi:hypothetical protein